MSNIIGFSKGLYTSWFFHSPTRSLFDCGEGCSSFLGNKVFAVENIFLSHGHLDHVSGLPSFLGIRQKARGDHEKPLNIFYPKGTREIENIRKYWESLWYDPLTYSLNWIPVEPNTDLPNNVVSFQTQHCRSLSLGYKVIESRKRLKAKYVGADIKKLLVSKQAEKSDLMEEYVANSFVYTLDSNRYIDPAHLQGAQEWIADTTFINGADRDGGNTHGTLDEMVTLANCNGVKRIYCAHFSPRYSYDEIETAIFNERKLVSLSLEIVPIHFNSVQNF
jgi:ribonuclease Z